MPEPWTALHDRWVRAACPSTGRKVPGPSRRGPPVADRPPLLGAISCTYFSGLRGHYFGEGDTAR